MKETYIALLAVEGDLDAETAAGSGEGRSLGKIHFLPGCRIR